MYNIYVIVDYYCGLMALCGSSKDFLKCHTHLFVQAYICKSSTTRSLLFLLGRALSHKSFSKKEQKTPQDIQLGINPNTDSSLVPQWYHTIDITTP